MSCVTRYLVLLSVLVMVGCGARSSVNDASSGSQKDGEHGDAPLDGRRDVPVWDLAKWRDLSKKDHWPWPRDTYSTGGGSPFGCQVDSDCFGVKCCPTPWGVHLCAADCDQLRP